MTTETLDSVSLSGVKPDRCNYHSAGTNTCWTRPAYIATLRYCWCDEHPGFQAADCSDGIMPDTEVPVCVDHAALLRDWQSLVAMRSMA